jgi:hypothetical protein
MTTRLECCRPISVVSFVYLFCFRLDCLILYLAADWQPDQLSNGEWSWLESQVTSAAGRPPPRLLWRPARQRPAGSLVGKDVERDDEEGPAQFLRQPNISQVLGESRSRKKWPYRYYKRRWGKNWNVVQ